MLAGKRGEAYECGWCLKRMGLKGQKTVFNLLPHLAGLGPYLYDVTSNIKYQKLSLTFVL